MRVRAPLRDAFVTTSRVAHGEEVELTAVLESVHGGILATGTVEAGWAGPCRRCLRPVSGHLSVDVRELFAEQGDPEVTYPLLGDQLDLEPLARDAVVLELPLAPVCAEDCAGLCPECGTDLNESNCECERPPRDPRWAALDALRVPGRRYD